MLLAVDIGNTDIVLGISNKEDWLYNWRIPGEKYTEVKQRLHDAANTLGIRLMEIEQTVISSVVPGLTPVVRATLASTVPADIVMIGPAVYPSLRINIKNPEEIGTDLVANAVAAYELFNQGCVVVDFGTALTFTTVDEDGTMLGVAIAPGLKTAVKALFQHTAQLPEVPLVMPATAIGKGTTEAVQAGVLLGYVGLVESILDRIQEELSFPCKVVATGGLSSVLTPLNSRFDLIDKNLTLNGLRVISSQYNQSRL